MTGEQAAGDTTPIPEVKPEGLEQVVARAVGHLVTSYTLRQGIADRIEAEGEPEDFIAIAKDLRTRKRANEKAAAALGIVKILDEVLPIADEEDSWHSRVGKQAREIVEAQSQTAESQAA